MLNTLSIGKLWCCYVNNVLRWQELPKQKFTIFCDEVALHRTATFYTLTKPHCRCISYCHCLIVIVYHSIIFYPNVKTAQELSTTCLQVSTKNSLNLWYHRYSFAAEGWVVAPGEPGLNNRAWFTNQQESWNSMRISWPLQGDGDLMWL